MQDLPSSQLFPCCLLAFRVWDPQPFHADPDPGLYFFLQKLVFFLPGKSFEKTLDPDQNTDLDPDPGTIKMRIQIQELQKCGSNKDPDPKPCRPCSLCSYTGNLRTIAQTKTLTSLAL